MTDSDYEPIDDTEPVVVPITDTLDLHHFKPADIPDLVQEYIRACREQGIHSIRIIHGKGKGIAKDRVQGILRTHPHVRSFSDAAMGNWGATCAELIPSCSPSPDIP